MAPLIQILDIETVLLKLTVDRNFETSLRLNLALNWNWPFPGQSGHWNGGMQKVRSNQPREQRISKNWFPLHRPLPRILHWESKKITELRQGFSLITSTQFMACFMTYISDIFGLGNSFRRMLHTMYVIVLLLKNVPYYESNRKLRNKRNSWAKWHFGENIFCGLWRLCGRKLGGLIPCHTGQREYLFLMLQH